MWKSKCKVKLTQARAKQDPSTYWKSPKFTMFREESTSALAGFHAGPLQWWNWNLEMILVGFCPRILCREENLAETRRISLSKAKTNNKLNTHMAGGRNRTRAALVGGECSHYCDIPAPHLRLNLKRDIGLPSGVSEQIPDTVRYFPSVHLHCFSCARARQEYIQPWAEK